MNPLFEHQYQDGKVTISLSSKYSEMYHEERYTAKLELVHEREDRKTGAEYSFACDPLEIADLRGMINQYLPAYAFAEKAPVNAMCLKLHNLSKAAADGLVTVKTAS